MKRDEWQQHYGLIDDEMSYLEAVLRVFDGKIVGVVDNPKKEILRP